MHLIPPTPLIKVASELQIDRKTSPTPLIKVVSDAKLQPTTLNGGVGGGGGAVCILLMRCIIGSAFLLGRLFFSWSVLTIFQLVVLVLVHCMDIVLVYQSSSKAMCFLHLMRYFKKTGFHCLICSVMK